MKFEQFKPWFQILQIMENTMLAGVLRARQRWDSPLAVIISQRQHSGLPKSENLKSWPKNVQNSLKLPKIIIKYLNLCIGGVLS
jgi:hypothetical protein